MQLIQTKLYRPPAHADLVDRPRLRARLHEGLHHKLILVSAPPGFGKTTLASQWLGDCGHPTAWLSLDDGDNHLPRFLRYVCAAVCPHVPGACATLQSVLTAVNLPGVDDLAALLVEELNALPVGFILVFDDYHCIRSRDVHAIMRHLLRYLSSRLHLVILTRSDPPLSLGRLRLGQQITEIRATDLQFTLTETRRFLHTQTDQPLGDEVLQSLQMRTEGWVIGLLLAGISLQSQSPDQVLKRFSGNHRLLVGYLVEEVMADLPEAVAAFLTRTALVDRFCTPLGDALLADSPWPASSHTTIAQLEAQNLLIIPLDDEGNWYRYHDLFRDFLLHRLKSEQGTDGLVRLHQQAGDWLARAGLIEDALRHALAAGNAARAADLVEINLHPLLNQKVPAAALERWLDLFPAQMTQVHPGLRIAQLYLFAFRWDLASMAATIDQTVALAQADRSVDAERQRLRLAVLDALRGYLLYWQGHVQPAIPLLQRGLDQLNDPVAYAFTVAQLTLFLALAFANCGQRQTSLTLLRTALTEATAHHRPVMMIFLGGRTLIHWYAGELADVAATAEHMLATADLWQAHPAWSGVGLVHIWRGWAHYFLGAVRYEQNDLVAAARHWQQVEAMRYQVNPGALHNSLTGLAFIARAQGEAVRALAYAQAAREFALALRSLSLLALSEVLEVRLALLGGNPVEALRRAQEINTATHHGNALWLEPPHMTVLRALLIEATPASLTTAEQLAETGLRHAENAHNTRQIVQFTALQALIWHALRHPMKAFEALERALSTAEPGGLVRTFLDLGPPLAELLQKLDHQRGPSPYLKRLQAAFAGELAPPSHNGQTAQYAQRDDITPLTPRELELLPLVDQRLTIAEMAERLAISPNTVKKHVQNIYAKLGVNNRRQAIIRAKSVGLLPST